MRKLINKKFSYSRACAREVLLIGGLWELKKKQNILPWNTSKDIPGKDRVFAYQNVCKTL